MKTFKALSTLELRYLLQKHTSNIEFYVLAIDEIKHIKSKRFLAIVNNRRKNESGQHWVAMFKKNNSSTIEFFDSLAMPFTFYGREISDYVTSNNYKLKRNTIRFQSFTSLLCGYMCVYFLTIRLRSSTFEKALQKMNFNSVKKTEEVIKDFFKKTKFPKFTNCKTQCMKNCKIKSSPYQSVCIQKNKKCINLSCRAR